jgi:hypothetical protein
MIASVMDDTFPSELYGFTVFGAGGFDRTGGVYGKSEKNKRIRAILRTL